MFKCVHLFEIDPSTPVEPATLDRAFEQAAFRECGAHEYSHYGWVPVCEGEPVQHAGDYSLMKLRVDAKKVPKGQVEASLARYCKQRQVDCALLTRKARRAIVEEIEHELLPTIFPKADVLPLAVDTSRNVIMVGTSSRARAEEAVALLLRSSEGMELRLMRASYDPSTAMDEWLADEFPDLIQPDETCHLRSESGESVSYRGIALDQDEIGRYRDRGLRIVRLGIVFNERLRCELGTDFTIKNIELRGESAELSEQIEKENRGAIIEAALYLNEIGGLVDAFRVDLEERAAKGDA